MRMWMWLVPALVGCGSDVHPFGPPPLLISHGPAVSGHTLDITVEGVEPFATVWIGAAAQQTTGPCPPVLQGDCLAIGPSPRVIGRATADANGVATRVPFIPPSVTGSIALQVAALETSGPLLSTPWTTWVHGTGPDVGRGAWFWRGTGHPNGAGTIVGDLAEETRTLEAFDRHGIERVYSSYDWAATGAEDAIAAWHTRLHPDRQVQLLLGENTWIYEAFRPNLLAIITTRLLDFHVGRPAEAQFDGVHLDVEPQGLPDWGTSTPAEKRDLLMLLATTFSEVRAHMDAGGASHLPLYADLPVWFDNVGGSIGWLDAADRDAWFADICTSLTGVSLMAFERDSLGSIESGTDWERANLGCEVRMALEADVGATWATALEHTTMIAQVEQALGLPVDLQSWTQTMDAW